MKKNRVERCTFDEEFISRIDPRWGGEASIEYMMKVLGIVSWNRHVRAFSVDEKPMWAWGAVKLWDSVADVWCCFDKSAGRYAREILLYASNDIIAGQCHFKRLQGHIPVEAPTVKLAQRFGFSIEGLMERYGRGAIGDYIVVARLADGN